MVADKIQSAGNKRPGLGGPLLLHDGKRAAGDPHQPAFQVIHRIHLPEVAVNIFIPAALLRQDLPHIDLVRRAEAVKAGQKFHQGHPVLAKARLADPVDQGVDLRMHALFIAHPDLLEDLLQRLVIPADFLFPVGRDLADIDRFSGPVQDPVGKGLPRRFIGGRKLMDPGGSAADPHCDDRPAASSGQTAEPVAVVRVRRNFVRGGQLGEQKRIAPVMEDIAVPPVPEIVLRELPYGKREKARRHVFRDLCR